MTGRFDRAEQLLSIRTFVLDRGAAELDFHSHILDAGHRFEGFSKCALSARVPSI